MNGYLVIDPLMVVAAAVSAFQDMIIEYFGVGFPSWNVQFSLFSLRRAWKILTVILHCSVASTLNWLELLAVCEYWMRVNSDSASESLRFTVALFHRMLSVMQYSVGRQKDILLFASWWPK